MRQLIRASAGFTLIEMIMVIVITGILAGIVAVFITNPVQGYVDAVRRAELTDQADVALRRITRDVRRALPNSLRLKDASNATVASCDGTADCYVEFVLTKSGGRYRDWVDGSTGGNRLNFTNFPPVNNPDCAVANNCFDILGKNSAADSPLIDDDDYIVVYNLGAGYSPADIYASANCTTGNCTSVTLTSGTPYRATMASNVFASQSPPLPSPSARFQVVGQNDRVIRYGCTGGGGGALSRYANCEFANTSNCAPPSLLAGSATAEPRARCVIEYRDNATGRNGLLYISLTLTDTPSGEAVTLFQQIHVDNSP